MAGADCMSEWPGYTPPFDDAAEMLWMAPVAECQGYRLRSSVFFDVWIGAGES